MKLLLCQGVRDLFGKFVYCGRYLEEEVVEESDYNDVFEGKRRR